MFLVCPNCDARYEVDDSAIPLEGREVQCTNCSEVWFQERALKLSGAALTSADTVTDDFEDDDFDEELKSSFSKILSDAPQVKPEPAPTAEPPIEFPPKTQTTEPSPAEAAAAAVFKSRRSETEQQAAPEPAPITYKHEERVVAPEPVQESAPTEPLITPRQPAAGQSVIDILRREAEYSSGQVAQPAAETLEAAKESEAAALANKAADALPLRKSSEPETTEPAAATEPEAPAQVSGEERTVADILMDRQRAARSVDPDSPVMRSKVPNDVVQKLEASAQEAGAPEIPSTKPSASETVADVLSADEPTERPRGKRVFADVEEVGTKLDQDADGAANEAEDGEDAIGDLPEPLPIGALEGTNHFMGGLYAGLACVVIGVLVYMFGSQISGQFPGLTDSIGAYTQRVDEGRQVVQDLYSQGGEPGLSNFFNNAVQAISGG